MKLNKLATDWLKEQNACLAGFTWATRNCATLREVVKTARPDWSVWVFFRPGVLTDRELWLFACHFAEEALPAWYAWAPDDHRPRVAIEMRRRWLDGQATDEELAEARKEARAAVEAARAVRALAVRALAVRAWAEAEARAAAARAAVLATAVEQKEWLLANTTPAFVDEL